MNDRLGVRRWSLCVAMAVLAGAARADDGIWLGISTAYGTAANWVDGIIAGGAGATMTSYSANGISLPTPPAAGISTNIVLGHIRVPEDAQSNANIPMYPGFGMYGHTGSLVLDSGVPGEPATIRNDCVTNTARMYIRSDLTLRSDLLISYNPTNWMKNPHTALYLTGDIAEEGGPCGLTVDNGTPQNQIALFGENAFTGDIEVRQGGLRAQSYTRLGGPGRQFGRDNTVIVTNEDSQLDLGGFSFGPDQSLVLAGFGMIGYGTSGRHGALAASQQTPCYTSVWSGPVTLAGNAAVGMGYCSYYPRKTGGPIALSGPISDQGMGYTLYKTSFNTLFLRGTNTYGGGTVISNGYLSATCKENLGTGPLVCAGGAFLFETPWDLTSAGVALTNAPGQDVRLRTAGQNVTFQGELGPFNANVYKSGH